MKRPYTFSDIVGQTGVINYITANLEKGTLSHFLIFEGAEGLGKTSIADLIALSLVYGGPQNESYKKAYDEVICKNASNDNIKRFKCSVDGGKDVAKLIKDEMNSTFMLQGPKVIICDECHGLTDQAQDVFLSETEFINDNVYVIMLTTEITKLKASLRSRAFPIHLEPLRRNEMLSLLKKEVVQKQLKLQNEDATIQMIADWSECKPRTGLNILGAFSNGTAVTNDMVRSLIGYLDVNEVLPLLHSLGSSMTFGLSYIDEMPINQSLITIVTECINIKAGQPSYRIKFNDLAKVKEQLASVEIDQLITFLYGITAQPRITKSSLIHAYIKAHQSYSTLIKADTSDVLATEDVQRASIQMELDNEGLSKAPTIAELLADSAVVTP